MELKKQMERIYATTDKSKGALKKLADNQGYWNFCCALISWWKILLNCSWLLLPIAVSGISIDQLMKGASDAREAYLKALKKWRFNICKQLEISYTIKVKMLKY